MYFFKKSYSSNKKKLIFYENIFKLATIILLILDFKKFLLLNKSYCFYKLICCKFIAAYFVSNVKDNILNAKKLFG